VAVTEVSLDIVLSKMKYVRKLFRILALEDYLNLHNTTKI